MEDLAQEAVRSFWSLFFFGLRGCPAGLFEQGFMQVAVVKTRRYRHGEQRIDDLSSVLSIPLAQGSNTLRVFERKIATVIDISPRHRQQCLDYFKMAAASGTHQRGKSMQGINIDVDSFCSKQCSYER